MSEKTLDCVECNGTGTYRVHTEAFQCGVCHGTGKSAFPLGSGGSAPAPAPTAAENRTYTPPLPTIIAPISPKPSPNIVTLTQAEAASLVRLVEAQARMIAWLELQASNSDAQADANRNRFPSLVNACEADARNYRAMAKDQRAHALSAALVAKVRAAGKEGA